MVKVGDSLIVTGKRGHFIPVGSKVTVVEVDNNSVDRTYSVESESGLRQWVYKDDLQQFSPPQKITQNGYEYELVGPVKPEWLVDGDWVVDKETGRKYRVSCENGVYTLNNGTREVIIDFISLPTRFRPHSASDWKWGDWAMYEGKRVFVMNSPDPQGCVEISGKPITHTPLNGWDIVYSSKLTPTF